MAEVRWAEARTRSLLMIEVALSRLVFCASHMQLLRGPSSFIEIQPFRCGNTAAVGHVPLGWIPISVFHALIETCVRALDD